MRRPPTLRATVPENRPRRRFFGTLARTLVTLGALAWLVRVVPLDEVAGAFASASLLLVLGGFAAQLSLRTVNAARIRLIARAQGAPLSYRAILATLFTTAFYGLALPGSIGAGAATLVKYVGHGATLAAALTSMILNRLIDTVTTVTLGLFFWGLEHRAAGAGWTGATWLPLFAPLLLLAFHVAFFGHARLMERIAGILGRIATARGGRIGRGAGQLLEQFEVAGRLRPGAATAVALLSVVKELLAILALWCFAHACGIELAFVTVAWMQAVVAMLVLLPITVLGLGVREGALVLMSARYGIAAPVAVSWSLLSFAGILVVAAIGGLIEAHGLWLRRPRNA